MRKTRLKDTLPLFKPGQKSNSNRPWVKDEFPEPANGITLVFAGPQEVETSIQAVRAKASDIGKLQARRFVDLLKLGHKPGEAAHRMHSTVRDIMQNPDAKKMVQELADQYALSGEDTKLLIRSLRNKIMLTSDDPKLQLEAAKQASEDPDVGLKGGTPVAQVDVTLRAMLQRPVEPLPGLEEPKGEVVDTTIVEKEKE